MKAGSIAVSVNSKIAVQRHDATCFESLGNGDQGGVGKIGGQIIVLTHHFNTPIEIFVGELLDAECAGSNPTQAVELDSAVVPEHVRDFSKNGQRRVALASPLPEPTNCPIVASIICVEQRD